MDNSKPTILTLTLIMVLTVLFTGCTVEGQVNPPTNHDGINQTQPSQKVNYTEPNPPSVDPSTMENLTHQLINREREEKGLEPLEWNGELAAVARNHSKYLAGKEQNQGFNPEQGIYISHTGRDGEEHPHRLEEAEIYYVKASAENVAGISSVNTYYPSTGKIKDYRNSSEITEKAVEGWMNSTGHRKNILNPQYEEAGMGIATDSNETNYIFTQVFIDRAECGYRTGSCCDNQACFKGLTCIQGTCLNN